MENVILGLLLLQPRTIYQLRKRIDEGLNLMYSCSTGSIQAALRKLLKEGNIDVSEVTEQGKCKKLYRITEKGKAQFDAWVNSEIDSGSANNPEPTKIYFFGFADKLRREKSIEQHVANMKNIHTALEDICREGETLLAESAQNDILFYQLQTAKYGRDLMKFNINWYSRLLTTIRRNEQ